MGISRESKKRWKDLTESDQDRIARMAWEDRTSFDVIESQFGLTPNETEKFMRSYLNEKSYKRWRRRANTQGHLKHRKKRGPKGERFKCSRQTVDGVTKGWK